MRELKDILNTSFFREAKINKNTTIEEKRKMIFQNQEKLAFIGQNDYPKGTYLLAVIEVKDKKKYLATTIGKDRYCVSLNYSGLQRLIIANY